MSERQRGTLTFSTLDDLSFYLREKRSKIAWWFPDTRARRSTNFSFRRPWFKQCSQFSFTKHHLFFYIVRISGKRKAELNCLISSCGFIKRWESEKKRDGGEMRKFSNAKRGNSRQNFCLFNCSLRTETFHIAQNFITSPCTTTKLCSFNWQSTRRKTHENESLLKQPSLRSTARRIFHKIQFHQVFIRRDVSEMENFPHYKSVRARKTHSPTQSRFA